MAPREGVTWQAARRELLRVIAAAIESAEASRRGSSGASGGAESGVLASDGRRCGPVMVSALPVTALALLVASAAAAPTPGRVAAAVAAVAFLALSGMALGAAVLSEEGELEARLARLATAFERAVDASEAQTGNTVDDSPANATATAATAAAASAAAASLLGHEGGGFRHGSPLVSVFAVYRGKCWQRIPALLCVKGDLIALATGDASPCAARLVTGDDFDDGDDIPGGGSDEEGADSSGYGGGNGNEDGEVDGYGDGKGECSEDGEEGVLAAARRRQCGRLKRGDRVRAQARLPLHHSMQAAAVSAGPAPRVPGSQPAVALSQPPRAPLAGAGTGAGGVPSDVTGVLGGGGSGGRVLAALSPSSPDLLGHCGGLRVFRLLETPLAHCLAAMLRPQTDAPNGWGGADGVGRRPAPLSATHAAKLDAALT